jgi:hypothetical protein
MGSLDNTDVQRVENNHSGGYKGNLAPDYKSTRGMDVGGVRYLFKEVVAALSMPAPAIYRRVRAS